MNDSDLERDSDSDRDRDIATILQYLIRSGQVRIIAATSPHLYNEGSDEELTSSRSPPKVDHHPDTSSLKGSDLSQAILLSTGALNDRHTNSPPGMIPLPSMLRSRELGMNGRHHFTLGDRCQIMQRNILALFMFHFLFKNYVVCNRCVKFEGINLQPVTFDERLH
ncbi:DDB1-and CUL4-associated factor 11 [Trichonephila clavipes]|uniref:DDB1-and CUL4-associated factor 11 n=1 Tax=Trichonephila clavipes TaxID=2585209 RepID=A0A8X6RET5_TRICX|nr:DDB1-and CUL4-associated factor 11 [Trichonephila clavipes]